MTVRPNPVPAGHDRHVRVVEEARAVTPFGLRLWDWATDRPAVDGLTVEARPRAGGPSTTAVVTRSGTFALSRLPGLAAQERPSPDGDPFASTRPFTVRVVDTAGRFNPTGFTVDLPRAGRYPAPGDLAPINGTSTEFPGHPLFSAPTRPIPPGFAAVRAELRLEPDDDAEPLIPAAFAVLRVDVGPNTWFGAANGAGTCLVVFPFPDFRKPDGSDGPGIEPRLQRFDIEVSVRYGALTAHPWIGAPTFDQIRSQPVGRLKAAADDPPVDRLPAVISPGRGLVLVTEPSTGSPPIDQPPRETSVLLIEAA